MNSTEAKRWTAIAVGAVLAVVAAAGALWWWRAPGHGGVVTFSGTLPEPYVLEGGILLRVASRDEDCIAFKIQNPMPRSDSFGIEFERRPRGRYRARIDLREALLGGPCEWRIEQLSVGVYRSVNLSPGDTVFSLTTRRELGDDRPRWRRSPVVVHCTGSENKVRCPDAVDAIYPVEPEGHYELNVEVTEAPQQDGKVP